MGQLVHSPAVAQRELREERVVHEAQLGDVLELFRDGDELRPCGEVAGVGLHRLPVRLRGARRRGGCDSCSGCGFGFGGGAVGVDWHLRVCRRRRLSSVHGPNRKHKHKHFDEKPAKQRSEARVLRHRVLCTRVSRGLTGGEGDASPRSVTTHSTPDLSFPLATVPTANFESGLGKRIGEGCE
jgi:hypothetical protein